MNRAMPYLQVAGLCISPDLRLKMLFVSLLQLLFALVNKSTRPLFLHLRPKQKFCSHINLHSSTIDYSERLQLIKNQVKPSF